MTLAPLPTAGATLAAWLHDLSPFLVRFSDTLGIRWYGLAYALGFVLAYLQLRWLARRGVGRLPAHRVADALTMLLVGVLVGGRLGYVLVYDPSLLTSFTTSPPWWGLFRINQGGMAFHGAIVGIAIACMLIARGFRGPDGTREGRMPLLHLADLCCLVGPPGLMLGRLANFVNGELLGKIVANPGEPAPWWSVKFPQEIASSHRVPYTPEQQLRVLELLERFAPAGSAGTNGWADRAASRLLDALSTRTGPDKASLVAELAPLVSARHASQLYQACAEGPLLGAALWLIWRRPRRAGVVSAWFLIIYGLTRAIIEHFFRLPDPQLLTQRLLGLSRGQWLSLAMVAAGAILLAWIAARTGPRLGGQLFPGWGRASARPAQAQGSPASANSDSHRG